MAVVTGAASGIGLALAERFVAEGMKVVTADIEAGAFATASDRLRRHGAASLATRVDVSRPRGRGAACRAAATAEPGGRADDVVGAVERAAGAGAGRGHARARWRWGFAAGRWGGASATTTPPASIRAGVERGLIENPALVAVTRSV